jgi:drug/metabolite transporter (DMT)-like permease
VSTAIAATAALAAAFCFAVGSLVQQGVAVRESGKGILSFRMLLSLVRQRRWVGGVLLAAGSFAIQGLALAFGPLTLVQPLAATDVLFALPLIARRNRRRLTPRDATGAFLVTAGVVIFLTVSAPRSGHGVPSLSAWLPVLAAIGAVTFGSAFAAWHVRGPARVVWLAAAAGALYGLLDALTKTSVDILSVSGAHVLATWGPYAMIGVAVIGALFGQSAYGSGALSLSLPVIDTVEPVAAVTIGATVFGERLASSAPLLAIQLAGGAVAVAGIAVLSRSSVVRTETDLSVKRARPR